MKIKKSEVVMIRDMRSSAYDIDYLTDKGLFVLCISKHLQDFMINLRADLPIVKAIGDRYGFSWAGNDLVTGFGFIAQGKDRSPLTFLCRENDSIVVTAEVPSVASERTEECRYCFGTGKDRDGEDDCFACRGNKVRPITDDGPLFALAATLHLIFYCGQAIDHDVKPGGKRRLIDIDTMLDRGFHGASLGGKLYKPLMEFLHSKRRGNAIIEVKQAMLQAHIKAEAGLMWREIDDEFVAFYHPSDHHLYMLCPGNACEVGSEMYRGREIETVKFSCHNVDTMTQQICFLAGLGALCGAARRAGF